MTPPEVPIPGIEGGGNAKAMPSGFASELLLQIALNVLELLFFAFADIPWLEIHEEETGVRALHLSEKREVGDSDNAFDARGLEQRVGDLLLGGIRALRRSAVGKLQREEHVALVFRGDESAGKAAAQVDRDSADQDEAEHGEG